ncbi:hypothetical protein DMENIID0001_061050 [Sergentomyia squamirostris]
MQTNVQIDSKNLRSSPDHIKRRGHITIEVRSDHAHSPRVSIATTPGCHGDFLSRVLSLSQNSFMPESFVHLLPLGASTVADYMVARHYGGSRTSGAL